MRSSKAGQLDYKPADRFINWWPIYKPVRFTIGLQHNSSEYLGQNHALYSESPALCKLKIEKSVPLQTLG